MTSIRLYWKTDHTNTKSSVTNFLENWNTSKRLEYSPNWIEKGTQWSASNYNPLSIFVLKKYKSRQTVRISTSEIFLMTRFFWEQVFYTRWPIKGWPRKLHIEAYGKLCELIRYLKQLTEFWLKSHENINYRRASLKLVDSNESYIDICEWEKTLTTILKFVGAKVFNSKLNFLMAWHSRR